MFKKKLKIIFLFFTIFATIVLILNLYSSYKFDNNPISNEIKFKITQKKIEIVKLVKLHYYINFNVPIIITDKMDSSLYGLTYYDGKRKIQIFLNKKRLKENLNYILEDVLPHEYAHALVFRLGKFRGDGHSKEWQKICLNLNGKRCDRFVNNEDIVMEKMKF